jgi:hypothetical protein
MTMSRTGAIFCLLNPKSETSMQQLGGSQAASPQQIRSRRLIQAEKHFAEH